MNYDSFNDSVKSIGDLTFLHNDSEYTILLPFVSQTRKVHLVVESEQIFFEETKREVEAKKIEIIEGGCLDTEYSKELKSMFGALLTTGGAVGGKLNVNKVGCTILMASDEEKTIIKSFYETSLIELNQAVDDIILKTSGHMEMNFDETMLHLQEGLTYFGYIHLVKERLEHLIITKDILVDSMCNEGDLDGFFNRFMETMETYYTAMSTVNLAQI